MMIVNRDERRGGRYYVLCHTKGCRAATVNRRGYCNKCLDDQKLRQQISDLMKPKQGQS